MKIRDFYLPRVLLFQAVICIFPLIATAQSAAMPVPTLPNINTNNVVNITSFGAVSSTTLTNTTAIQSAINSAATTNGGCTVEIPTGIYLSGPLTLKSGINLQVDNGATLKMLAKSNWPGSTTFISGSSIHDVEISGPGTIDGNAQFGSSEWWGVEGADMPASSRPNFIQFSSSSSILIQDVTLQNPPTFHVMIKNNNANITVRRITMNTPGDSSNTDAFDIASTNVLIQNCFISVGDDDAEIGGSQLAAEITITNCTFATGHGVSIGSITSGGVSNVLVVNCTFNGTDYGIRLKSNDHVSTGSGDGGIVQNLSYLNLGMTNILHGAVVIYSYYASGGNFGTPSGVTPFIASTQAVDITTIPVWRNIVISNVTASVVGSGVAGIIWARMEVPATNIVFSRVNISAPKEFDVYNAAQIQFLDSKISNSSSPTNILLYNAQVVVSNSVPTNTLFIFGGLVTNGYVNRLAFYNAQGLLKVTNVLAGSPGLTLAGSTLAVSNHLNLEAVTPVNFTLGTNAATIIVRSNLVLNSTLNLTAGPGFCPGSYTILTYGGSFGGSPVLGALPVVGHSYLYSLETNTPKQVNFIVSNPPPPHVNGITLVNGTNAVLSGTGGNTNFNVYVLASTNIALPAANWRCIATNQFLANGNFNFTNALPPGAPQAFYLLQYP